MPLPQDPPGGGWAVRHDAATTIQRPVDDVARYLFDPRTMPQWSAVLVAVEDPDDRSIVTRGRRLTANLQILGVTLTVDGRLVALDLDQRRGRIRLDVRGSDGRVEHELQLDDVGGATVVHLRNLVVPPTWLAETVAASVLQAYVERTTAFALDTVKSVLEAHAEQGVADAIERAAAVLPPPASDLRHPPT